jgi:hypothetical protein
MLAMKKQPQQCIVKHAGTQFRTVTTTSKMPKVIIDQCKQCKQIAI